MAARYPALRLSVVFPAYNEEGNIERTIRRSFESLRRMVGAFEILLIDNGLYEVTGGAPALVNFAVENGTYVVPKVLDRGYLALGKDKLEFRAKGQ